MPGTCGASTDATDAVPVPSTGTAKEVGPLLLSAEARARGEPCEHLPTSLVGGQTSGCIPASLDSTCTVPVYKLICNCK
jgi:hypothetical protein